MDALLDRKIRFNNQTKYKRLYSWCLQEVENNGEEQGIDLIPWNWSLYFTASELRLSHGITGEIRENILFQDFEYIHANLHPGVCNDGKRLEDDVSFSMFGASRAITDFTLRITTIDGDEKEYCRAWGHVSYMSEISFRYRTEPDRVGFELGLSKKRFDKLASLISNKTIDVVRLRLKDVSGFYSQWSPDIFTDNVKVLTDASEHEIDTPEGCETEIPKLGDVGKFNLELTTRSKLNPKQSLESLNISKLFEDDFELFEVEEEIEEPEDVSKLLLEQISRNQLELLKLKTPVWLITLFLGLLLFSLWLS
jgi:hypothetical protein